MMTKTKTDFVF